MPTLERKKRIAPRSIGQHFCSVQARNRQIMAQKFSLLDLNSLFWRPEVRFYHESINLRFPRSFKGLVQNDVVGNVGSVVSVNFDVDGRLRRRQKLDEPTFRRDRRRILKRLRRSVDFHIFRWARIFWRRPLNRISWQQTDPEKVC